MRVFFKRIRKIIKYIPILWKNWHDWDYYTALDIFKFELNNIANHLESNKAFTISAKHNASRIRLAIKLLDRAYGDYYMDEYFDELESKYGTTTIDFVPIDETGELFKMIEIHDRELSEIEEENYKIDKEILVSKAYDKEQKAKRLAWKIIHQNIEHWWD
jgi:hypothetical protein